MKVKNWKSGTGQYVVKEVNIKQGELVVNGDFSDGTTGWGKLGGGSFSIVDEIAELNLVASTGRIVQTDVFLNLEVGKRYKLSATVKTDSSSVELSIGTTSSLGGAYLRKYYSGSGDWETITTEFTAVGADDVMIGTATTITSLIQVDNVSITEIPALPDLDNGVKYLENTAAGTASLPSKTAGGTWEWRMNKGANGNKSYIYPILDGVGTFTTNNGYIFYFKSNESISFDTVSSSSSTFPLLRTATSYIDNNTWYDLKVARLQSEGVFKDIETLQVSDLVNYNYTSFISYGRYGFSATSDGTTNCVAGTADEINFGAGERYLITFNASINNGVAPNLRFRTALNGGDISDIKTIINGRNNFILTSTSTATGTMVFRNVQATDYEITGLTIRRIYPADTFAVFIKGGDFGTDKWTLVDTNGGSGNNPCTDSTYTTSEYFVIDLDASDCITNLKITNGVKQ